MIKFLKNVASKIVDFEKRLWKSLRLAIKMAKLKKKGSEINVGTILGCAITANLESGNGRTVSCLHDE